MLFGYACINLSILARSNHSCQLKNARPDVLRSLIKQNLDGLGHILRYNASRGIRLFRISSGVIPFGSHPINQIDWASEYTQELQGLGALIKGYEMMVSMHPGQYTLINSPDDEVVQKSLADLAYHCRFLDSLGEDPRHKIILHIGGRYGDKVQSQKRFLKNSRLIGERIKRRLVLENDDRIYSIEDVLDLSGQTGFPVVFDYLHHLANPPDSRYSVPHWLKAACATWKPEDGTCKIHYSDPAPFKKKGSHARSINLLSLLLFMENMHGLEANIMLEGKDKNLSVERVMAVLNGDREACRLEQQRCQILHQVCQRGSHSADQDPPDDFTKCLDLARSLQDKGLSNGEQQAAVEYLAEQLGPLLSDNDQTCLAAMMAKAQYYRALELFYNLSLTQDLGAIYSSYLFNYLKAPAKDDKHIGTK